MTKMKLPNPVLPDFPTIMQMKHALEWYDNRGKFERAELRASLRALHRQIASIEGNCDAAWCPECRSEIGKCDEDFCCQGCGASLIPLFGTPEQRARTAEAIGMELDVSPTPVRITPVAKKRRAKR